MLPSEEDHPWPLLPTSPELPVRQRHYVTLHPNLDQSQPF